MQKQINILGTRGVPGSHGGYETFASQLAPYLAECGWEVIVYCQDDDGIDGREDEWEGVKRVHFTPKSKGALGTMEFDAKCIRDVVKRPGIDLVLGYNTASFNMLQRLRGRTIVMNMDGIEWKRQKWSLPAKAWFFMNELAGANLSTVLIADHPEMERHLRQRSFRTPIRMIAYGAKPITDAPVAPLTAFGLVPDHYMIMVARVTPENSYLEIIRAFSREKRNSKFVVLGIFDDADPYHRACREAASDEVIFPGAIFDPAILESLRFHARAYLHGHTVGGTNPSLCEALGAGNAVIAHDNRFNRWTAGPEQVFFADEDACASAIHLLLHDDARLARAKMGARTRHGEAFTWPRILREYEVMLDELAT